jgi:fatty acid desaturase
MNQRAVSSIEDRQVRDDSFVEIPVKLTKRELVKLSQISGLRSAFHVVAEWTMIIAAIYLVQRHWHPLLYLAAIAFIGARQHALMILMHDGVHRRLHTNRKINDWVSEIVLAWPNLISARAYRRNHFAHHRYLNTPRDPDWARRQGDPTWVFPKTWGEITKLLLRDVSGVNAPKLLALARGLMTTDTGVSKMFLFARYSFYAAVVAAMVWTGMTKVFLLYWVVPLFTWLIFIFRIRSIAEHSAIQGREPAYAQSRTTLLGVVERIFFAPKNVSYHLEHHFFPSVPFYRLQALHELLLTKPGFADSAHITNGYFGVLRECAGQDPSLDIDGELEVRDGVLLEPASATATG